MPTVTCMFRGPQPEAKCLVCAQARYACTHNAFMWRCVFELRRKGGLTGASRPRREACLPAPPGYRPVCSPQTSTLLLRHRGAALFANPTPKCTGNDPRHPALKKKKKFAAKGNICEQSWQPWLRRSLLVSGGGADCWQMESEVRLVEEIGSRFALRETQLATQQNFAFFPRDGNSAHVWMIDKLREAGRIRTGSERLESMPEQRSLQCKPSSSVNVWINNKIYESGQMRHKTMM